MVEDRYGYLRRRAEEMKASLRDAAERIADARYSCASEDERVTATVGPDGRLVDLMIDPRVFRRPDSERLCQLILELTARAAAVADGARNQMVSESFGGLIDLEKLAAGEIDLDTVKQFWQQDRDRHGARGDSR